MQEILAHTVELCEILPNAKILAMQELCESNSWLIPSSQVIVD